MGLGWSDIADRYHTGSPGIQDEEFVVGKWFSIVLLYKIRNCLDKMLNWYLTSPLSTAEPGAGRDSTLLRSIQA